MIPPIPTGAFTLFLDVDGTLLDIAPEPDAVVVPRSLKQDLEAADRLLGGALALVSGRTIANIDALFQPLKLRASGVHGAEFRFDPDGGPVMSEQRTIPDEVWADLLRVIGAFPGTMAENKAFSFAVHYRAAPESGTDLLVALERLVGSHAGTKLRIMPGHYVFELKSADFNKGVAVERFLDREEFRDRQPIFVGDDVTDWPGFAAATRRGGAAYSVGRRAPDVTGTFPDPTAVREWLRQIVVSASISA